MLKGTRIAVIGGGKMGGALIQGMIASGLVNAETVTVADTDEARLGELVRSFKVLVTTDNREAVRNAGRFLQEAGAGAVKVEGGEAMAPLIRRLVQAGIPVVGHIGLHGHGVTTGLADLPHDFVGGQRVGGVIDSYGIAGACRQQRRGSANTARSASDQNNSRHGFLRQQG